MLNIDLLKGKEKIEAYYEYNTNKYNNPMAYVSRWFGFYRVYTKQYLLFILFLITLPVGIGIIRWIIDLFLVGNYVKKKNKELDINIYNKYR